MKKFLAFVCAAVLTVASAVTAFAQPSVTVNGVVTGIASATDKNKNAAELVMEDGTDTTFAKYTDEQKKLINAIKDQATLKTLLGDKYTDGMTVVDLKDVYVKGNGTVEFPLTITFKVTGVNANSKAAVLHFNTETNTWEVLDTVVGEGTLTATFNSLSPVVFVVDKTTASNITGSTSTGSSSTTSPKTGEANVMAMAGGIALLAIAGMAVVTRRKRA